MDEVHFEEGGAVVQMRKSASETPKLLAKDPQENERNEVPLFESESYLPQVIGQVVSSTQENSQSVTDRIFGIVFLGH